MKLSRNDFLRFSGITSLTGAFRKAMAAVQRTRWGMAVDTAKCMKLPECNKCMVACHRAHNVPSLPERRHDVRWIWKETFQHAFPGQEDEFSPVRAAPVMVLCNHCENPPCVRVCPVQATFKSALLLFEACIPKTKKSKYCWSADCLQGRALACMGLKDWNAALSEIDAAIDRRLKDFEASNPCRCHGAVEMRLTKATILDKLGKSNEAVNERRLAAAYNNPHPYFPLGIERDGVPIGVYYDTLKRLRLNLENNGK